MTRGRPPLPDPYPTAARLQDHRRLIASLTQLTPNQLLTHCTDVLIAHHAQPTDTPDPNPHPDVLLDLTAPLPDPRCDYLRGRTPRTRPAFSPTPLLLQERWCTGCLDAWPASCFTDNGGEWCRACYAEYNAYRDHRAPTPTPHTPLALPHGSPRPRQTQPTRT